MDSWANRAGQAAVAKAVNEVRDWLGHPEVINHMSFRLADDMTKTFQSAIQLIGECASGIAEVASGLLGGMNIWLQVGEAIMGLLKTFLDAFTELAKSAVGIMAGYQKTSAGFLDRAANLKIPGDPPRSISDSDGWDVRPVK